jgi:hypothetical protein
MRKVLWIIVCILISVIITGCAPTIAEQKPEMEPSVEIPTVEPTAEPTLEPLPTPTPTPAPTPTPEPTPEPTPVIIPLEFTDFKLKANIIGTPEIYVRIKNNSDMTIDAFDFYVMCYDAYGELVQQYGIYDMVGCTYQEGDIKPGEKTPSGAAWTLYGQDTAKTIKLAFVKYHYKDGETIIIPEDEYNWIDMN